MKIRGQKGFAIVNIIVGVILVMASFVMFADPSTYPGLLITLPLGLVFTICGWLTGRRIRSEYVLEKTMKTTLTINFIIFILSCVVLAACCTILPIIGPML